jgi:general secretion pathway protein A
MYERFFGFVERPFDLTPNPRFLVMTDSHREALANLEYAIASRKGISLLVGEAGAGKTTLIRTAIGRQPERIHCVHVQNPALTRDEFVEILATRFCLSSRAASSKATLLEELESLLTRRMHAGETTVLIVDEAQSLSLDLLEEIRLLANIETNEQKLLTVILAGQPELADRLNDDTLRQLKQRVALRCELRRLTQNETIAYVAGRIRAAGGQGASVFTREAVTMIHERARGIPRTINVLADNALVTGFAAQHRPVTSLIVRDVCKDFDLSAEAEQPANPTLRLEPRSAAGRPSTPGTVLALNRSESADASESETDSPSAENVDERPMFGALNKMRRRFFSSGR